MKTLYSNRGTLITGTVVVISRLYEAPAGCYRVFENTLWSETYDLLKSYNTHVRSLTRPAPG